MTLCVSRFKGKREKKRKSNDDDEDEDVQRQQVPRMYLTFKGKSHETDALPPSLPTPSFLKPHPPHADCHTYQLRAYIYQARDMYASDKSGLSDPYAVMSFTRYSTRTRVVKESVCPTWDQTLLINQIRIFGTPQSVLDSPPPVVLELFDKDIVVSVH